MYLLYVYGVYVIISVCVCVGMYIFVWCTCMQLHGDQRKTSGVLLCFSLLPSSDAGLSLNLDLGLLSPRLNDDPISVHHSLGTIGAWQYLAFYMEWLYIQTQINVLV